MIKAAFFDVDGTLLSHKTKSVPQSARKAIAQLQSAGIPCIVATGRQIMVMNTLPVADIPFDGYITLNGQLILDKDQNIIRAIPVTGEVKEYFLQLFEEHTMPILLVEKDRMYLNFVNQQVVWAHEDVSSEVPPVGTYTGEQIYQICAYTEDRNDPLLKPVVGKCEITHWNVGGLDIIAGGGGKVSGIKRYLEDNQITPEEIIAFGDGSNDVQMLSFAGIGVAMGNGCDAAKKAADYITEDIDADGIYLALKHYGLVE